MQNDRKLFIPLLFQYLKGKPYAFLKYIYAGLDAIPEGSDIDLYLSKKEINPCIQMIKNHELVDHIHVTRKSFMVIVSVFFKDQSFLSLDLIHRFKRKTDFFLPIDDAIDIQSEKEIQVLRPFKDFQYTCFFYLLNGAKVPERYQSFLLAQSDDYQKEILEGLYKIFSIDCDSLEEFFDKQKKFRSKVGKRISKKNTGLGAVWSKWQYLKDTLVMAKGITITFSGVDGAGKTTILTKVKEMVEEKYRRPVKVLRHRPSILPILSAYKYGKEEAEKRTTERLPRTGGNKSKLSSIVRFAYYFVDYIFGQFIILYKYNWRGVTVIYDRYYYDFINDGRRSNIDLPSGWIKPLFAFLVKPQLNFFLYADPEVILKRKQELEKEAIEELNEKYLSLFERYDKKYKAKFIGINNIHIEETMDTIEKAYIEANK